MDLQQELDVALRARLTLIVIVSHEEERIVQRVLELCARSKRGLCSWDHADFFRRLTGNGAEPPAAKDPLSALEAIDQMQGEQVFVLRDFHQCWENQSRVVRKLRNTAEALKYTRKTIIVTTPTGQIPTELRDTAVVIDVPPPSFDELNAVLSHLLETPGVRTQLTDPQRARLVNLALGLSANQAQRVFAKAIVTDGVLDERDLDLIAEEKRQIIRGSGALEYYTAADSVNDVGGLETLKDWLRLREVAFREPAKAYGLPPPKGIALIGIPGTGKSLSAKMVANLWRLPLIRFDVGAVFGSLVGESEANIRKALHLAGAVAPCVLWIDELEKALATGDGDSGTSRRVLGSLLSWMQDKKQPVFIVATANDIERLPPELLRRGRFDEIFFLDLPNRSEREAIFEVHIRKRRRDPKDFDLPRLAAAAEGFVGAEIEQAVIDAMYAAFSDPGNPGREPSSDDIVGALKRLVPMSHSQRERVNYLRTWVVEGRAQSASKPDDASGGGAALTLDIMPQAAS